MLRSATISGLLMLALGLPTLVHAAPLTPLPPVRPPLLALPPARGPLLPYSASPYANGIRTTTGITVVRRQPTPLLLSAQTSVSAPDGGTVLLGGYNTARSGRNEFGPPGVGRPLRNVGTAQSRTGSTISVRARVIILAEEEERQTGMRSR